MADYVNTLLDCTCDLIRDHFTKSRRREKETKARIWGHAIYVSTNKGNFFRYIYIYIIYHIYEHKYIYQTVTHEMFDLSYYIYLIKLDISYIMNFCLCVWSTNVVVYTSMVKLLRSTHFEVVIPCTPSAFSIID